jgi:hypothetical protein
MRRVVVANVDGRSRVVEDGAAPRSREARFTPGFSNTLLWQTSAGSSLEIPTNDPTVVAPSFVPPVGGSSWLRLTLPPMSVFRDPSFDAAAAGAEHSVISPGITDLMEADNPGMHTTPSIDYDFVLDGTLHLELTDGEVELHAGDAVVQYGARHAWRNRSDGVATLLVVLMGTGPAVE